MNKFMKMLSIALVLMIVSSTSVFASSDTTIYLKYNGSTFTLGSYAYTSGGSSYNKISIYNGIEINDITAVVNSVDCFNTSSCQTTEISTYYNSSNDYLSSSEHWFYNNGSLVGSSNNTDYCSLSALSGREGGVTSEID